MREEELDGKFSFLLLLLLSLLPPANEVCEGNVLTGVCLSTGSVCIPACIQCGRGGVCPGGLPGGCLPRGISVRGCLLRGMCDQGGVHLPAPEADTSPWEPEADTTPPPPPPDAMGNGQQAGGTHPTRMHSCCCINLTELVLFKFILLSCYENIKRWNFERITPGCFVIQLPIYNCIF